MRICPVDADLFSSDGRAGSLTDGQTWRS